MSAVRRLWATAWERFDGLIVAVSVVLVIALVIWGMLLATNESMSHECRKLAEISGHRTKYYGMGSGCYVDVNGRMIPVDNWRGEADS